MMLVIYVASLVILGSCTCNEGPILGVLYNATSGSTWTSNIGWGPSGATCGTGGVTCNANGCVTLLYLYSNQLSGTIPSELGSLTALQHLDLYNNQLSGPIPSELGSLTALQRMMLDRNQLSGPIPSQLGSLTALTSLYLYSNQLSGAIPSQLGSMTALTYMHLSNNQLSGTIPSQLGSLTALQNLILNRNQLSGTIPSQLGSLTALTSLQLQSNQLSGTIPSHLGSLTAVTALYLGDNQLSGPIPSQLGSLTALTVLHANTNSLCGKIPTSLIPKKAGIRLDTNCLDLDTDTCSGTWGGFALGSQASCSCSPCTGFTVNSTCPGTCVVPLPVPYPTPIPVPTLEPSPSRAPSQFPTGATSIPLSSGPGEIQFSIISTATQSISNLRSILNVEKCIEGALGRTVPLVLVDEVKSNNRTLLLQSEGYLSPAELKRLGGLLHTLSCGILTLSSSEGVYSPIPMPNSPAPFPLTVSPIDAPRVVQNPNTVVESRDNAILGNAGYSVLSGLIIAMGGVGLITTNEMCNTIPGRNNRIMMPFPTTKPNSYIYNVFLHSGLAVIAGIASYVWLTGSGIFWSLFQTAFFGIALNAGQIVSGGLGAFAAMGLAVGLLSVIMYGAILYRLVGQWRARIEFVEVVDTVWLSSMWQGVRPMKDSRGRGANTQISVLNKDEWWSYDGVNETNEIEVEDDEEHEEYEEELVEEETRIHLEDVVDLNEMAIREQNDSVAVATTWYFLSPDCYYVVVRFFVCIALPSLFILYSKSSCARVSSVYCTSMLLWVLYVLWKRPLCSIVSVVLEILNSFSVLSGLIPHIFNLYVKPFSMVSTGLSVGHLIGSLGWAFQYRRTCKGTTLAGK